MITSFTLPVGRDPTENEIGLVEQLLDGLDWFSDYDSGISICTPQETYRLGPGQTVTRTADGGFEITGEEVSPFTGRE